MLVRGSFARPPATESSISTPARLSGRYDRHSVWLVPCLAMFPVANNAAPIFLVVEHPARWFIIWGFHHTTLVRRGLGCHSAKKWQNEMQLGSPSPPGLRGLRGQLTPSKDPAAWTVRSILEMGSGAATIHQRMLPGLLLPCRARAKGWNLPI